MTPPADGIPPFAGTVPLQSISLPTSGGAFGIPEVVLAAYRNAELALESSTPGCGLSWSLLAGIGRIESGHAGGGRTDAAGTSVTPIFGPVLDGSLPGNEMIPAAGGGFVRAIGPMQFLPGTWSKHAADGNGDGVADPHNVFDAALAAGKYLCSGALNLRDPAQELRAVLRYNNSMAYAATVLSWSAAYRTGAAPSQVSIAPNLIPPGTAPIQTNPEVLAANATAPTTTTELPPNTTTAPTPTEVMIIIPGLPPIPCGIFCPSLPTPVNPCEPQVIPAPMPRPGEPPHLPGEPEQPHAAAQEFGAQTREPIDTEHTAQPNPACTQPQAGGPGVQPPAPGPGEVPQEAVQQPQAEHPEEPTTTPEPGLPEAAEPAPTPPPGITLPFGIVVPLPAPPQG